jgi:ribosomal protein L37AE/L43A
MRTLDRPNGLLLIGVVQAHDVFGVRCGVPDFDLHRWFGEDELERCPACGEPAGVRLPTSGSFMCLSCGHLTAGSQESSNATSEDKAAGAEGLEPPTYGFGDRRSTN